MTNLLTISSPLPPVASLATLVTVAVGAVAASCAGRRQMHFERPTADDVVRASICGLTAYAVLGGRLTSLSPSNLSSVGAFGRRSASLQASRSYATDAQRRQLADLGRRFGCHTCGVKQSFQWIADHQPPQKIAALRDARWWKRLPFLGAPTSQRFFPQCAPCSQKQAAAVLVEIMRADPAGARLMLGNELHKLAAASQRELEPTIARVYASCGGVEGEVLWPMSCG